MAHSATVPSRKKLRVAAIALAASLVALLAWALVLEPRSLTVRDYRLELPRWPQACAGIRIAVIADLHAGSPYLGLDKVDRIVESVAAAHADLVLLAGDYVIQGIVGGTVISPEQIAAHLKPLKARSTRCSATTTGGSTACACEPRSKRPASPSW
jgi:uncharacterized protein